MEKETERRKDEKATKLSWAYVCTYIPATRHADLFLPAWTSRKLSSLSDRIQRTFEGPTRGCFEPICCFPVSSRTRLGSTYSSPLPYPPSLCRSKRQGSKKKRNPEEKLSKTLWRNKPCVRPNCSFRFGVRRVTARRVETRGSISIVQPERHAIFNSGPLSFSPADFLPSSASHFSRSVFIVSLCCCCTAVTRCARVSSAPVHSAYVDVEGVLQSTRQLI